MGRVAVPKTGQKTSSPREDATETSVGKVAVPKSGRGPFRGRFERDCWIVRHVGMPLEYLWAGAPCRSTPEDQSDDSLRPVAGRSLVTEACVGCRMVPRAKHRASRTPFQVGVGHIRLLGDFKRALPRKAICL